MIEWILHRPPHASHPAEIRVAEKLKALDDAPGLWSIVWGYYYHDARGTRREGDFLLLGPTGGLLVLEVKSFLPRHFTETGAWEGYRGNDPIQQLDAEWKGVLNAVRSKGNPPFIASALCIPEIDIPANVSRYEGIERKLLVARNDLDDWIVSWRRIFERSRDREVEQDQKRSVLEAFGYGALPEEKRAFTNHTEELFRRQFTSRFALLDQLSENRQLLVRGGTGTGKTWHALEQAFRYASQESGRRVLFLTYNKALTAQLRRIVALRWIERGEVLVRGWEELFLELCSLSGRPMDLPPPSSPTETIRLFYEKNLPLRVLEIARDLSLRPAWPVFDALVVDEGQDHDTRWHPEIETRPGESGGWWHIYQFLLRDGAHAQASVFYDSAQRPPFRAADRFDSSALSAAWSQPAHLRLHPAVRYTRPIWQFMRDHSHPATRGMIEALGRGDHLPEGPEPEVHSLPAGGDGRDLVESIIQRWKKSGLCEPHEILIVHAQSSLAASPLGALRVIAGHNLRECTEEEDEPNTIRHTSIHKAKGLDSKAVIIIGLASRDRLEGDFDHYSWFMAVSRARQLLAVAESA